MSQMNRARMKKENNREHKTEFCRPECFYVSHPFPAALTLTHLLPSLWLIVVLFDTHIFILSLFQQIFVCLCVTILTAVLTDCSTDLPFNNKANFVYVCTFESIMFGLLVNITIYDATPIHTYMHLFVCTPNGRTKRNKEASSTSK